MSEMVHYKGRLKLVDKLPNETLEEQCKRLSGADEVTKYYDSYREILEDTMYKTYVINGNNIYEIVSKKEIEPDSDLFIMSDNKDGTYDYEVLYYNGGCSFTEAIEEAFENME